MALSPCFYMLWLWGPLHGHQTVTIFHGRLFFERPVRLMFPGIRQIGSESAKKFRCWEQLPTIHISATWFVQNFLERKVLNVAVYTLVGTQ
ncbi:hypothetical protein F5146DRAFT_1069688 [Armillaria mellea]|nr:hypothetical protein F5146DRAFT_1069688 [Armillaria mellea]